MANSFKCSLKIDLTGFSGKTFKVLSDIVRSGIRQEHGPRAIKGVTDSRLNCWPLVIRFSTEQNRDDFMDTLEEICSPLILKRLGIQYGRPNRSNVTPIRWQMGA